MKNILVASYDLEIGGVERSLISLLDTMDVNRYKLDLMLYRHQGEFLNFLTPNVQLVEEIPAYTAFRKSIKVLLQEKRYLLTFTRLLAKAHCSLIAKWRSYQEPGYYQMQLMWKYAVPFLPTVKKKYDVAISYLWPHDCVAYKVKAKQKIAWIHTDYSQLEINKEQDLKIWKCFDCIIAVSEACKDAFLTIYPQLSKRVVVMENISAPEYIKKMALKDERNEMTKDPRFKLLTVARLSQAKGIDLAIEAMRTLKERGNHFVWYVVGYGGDEEHIRYLIKKYRLEEDFILLGKKTNPYPYMKASDVYVQPSKYEGKALTVVEAQILSKPVLITNYPTAKSQIENNIDGLICSMDAEGLIAGIERLFEDKELRQSLQFNCLQKNYHNTQELNKLYQLIDGDSNGVGSLPHERVREVL